MKNMSYYGAQQILEALFFRL